MSSVDVLKSVPWLSSLRAVELEEVAARAILVRFSPGQAIVGELEVGDELFILIDGTARVSVASGTGRRELGVLNPGDACGELALLTRQLRAATVTAIESVEALRLDRAEFEELIARHPTIAVHFARAIARRVVDTDAALDAVLSQKETPPQTEQLLVRASALAKSPGSLRRTWREMVLQHRSELPFFALLSFSVTLVSVRLGARVTEATGLSLFNYLRIAYLVGIVLVFGSTATSLIRFRRAVQRRVALVFGVGFALILNELSVFLAFDAFYVDMTTPDPKLVFNVETLYRRSESFWGIALAIAFLAQITFLRTSYRRALFGVRTRVARLLP